MPEIFDAIVIGGGPGGYVCAIRLAQLGLKTACVESRGFLGGTCLNVGCIPSKSLLHLSENYYKATKSFSNLGIEFEKVNLNLPKMMKNKEKTVTILTKGIEFLFKKNKVFYIKGTAKIKSKNEVLVKAEEKEIIYNTKNIIISTGSLPLPLPKIKFDEKQIISSTGALSLNSVPKKMVIVGAGYIGMEMGSVWSRLGSEIQVIEFLDHIVPGMDLEISKEFYKILIKQGIKFNLETKVDQIIKQKNSVKVIASTKNGNSKEFNCDVVLISVGRKPNSNGLNLEKLKIKVDKQKRIEVDNKFKTSVPNIFAIGDVIKGSMLAHKAEEEGIAVAEIIAGQAGHVNYDIIPGVIYTTPEVASVGSTEEQLIKLNKKYKVGKFPFVANPRAKTINETEGFVKILTDTITDKVLGVHIIGPHAGEMIAEAVLAMEFGASSEDIARTCHAHPTYSEAIKEAALAIDKRTIHS